ncbi:hypothetical protein BH23CHL2_BH23CHL2_03260 [soil metagenome]
MPTASQPALYTIGHSNQSAEEFIKLLQKFQIEVLVDVRSAPYSRWAPHFSKETLSDILTSHGVRYLYLGQELGGRPDPVQRPDLYDDDGHALYYLMAQEDLFLAGLQRLSKGLRRFRLAIMCSEEDPTHCHRRLLVGKTMIERENVELSHIRRDGATELESEVTLPGQPQAIQQSLFNHAEELQEVNPWRSTQSVLPRSQQRSFSNS